MNRQELVDFLNKIEKKYPVEKWTYNNEYVWPIIKLQIYFYYLHHFLEKGVSQGSKNKSRTNKVLDIINSFIDYIVLYFKPKAKGKWILATEGDNYLADINNTKVNKFYHPLKETLTNQGFKVLKLNSSNVICRKNTKKNTIYINKYYPFFRFWYKLIGFFSESKAFYPEYKSLVSEIEKEIPFKSPFQKGNEQKFLSRKVEQVFAYSKAVSTILNKYSFKYIFELCYYNTLNFSLTILANHKEIPVIEIQHGSMGPSHLAYSGWSKTPKEHYKLFPGTIWCWDQSSYDLINAWSSKTTNIQLLIGGNPWLSFIANSNMYNAEEYFQNKKIILYTMQRDYIEDFIYEAIGLSSDDFTWWLRPHPRNLQAVEKIMEKVKQYNIEDKVVIKKARDLPLPIILKNTYLHLSEFSGSIIEAALLGKHSIILSQSGVESYKKYIEEGMATEFLTKDPENLIKLIEGFDIISKSQNFVDYEKTLKFIIRQLKLDYSGVANSAHIER